MLTILFTNKKLNCVVLHDIIYSNRESKGRVLQINRLRELRIAKNLTGKDVAEYLHISPSFYSELERGNRTLTKEYLEKLADLYGVTVDYLIGRNETPPPPVEEFPKDVKVIMRDAKNLTPDQRRIILGIIKEFKDSHKT